MTAAEALIGYVEAANEYIDLLLPLASQHATAEEAVKIGRAQSEFVQATVLLREALSRPHLTVVE